MIFFSKKLKISGKSKGSFCNSQILTFGSSKFLESVAAQLSTISVFPVHSELQVTHNIDSTRQILAELAHGMAQLACKSNM